MRFREPQALNDRPEALRQSSQHNQSVVLAGLLLAAPLAFGAVQPWAWGALGLAASVLLLWWAATRIRGGVVRLVWSPLYLPGALFLLLGAAQMAGHHTLDPIGTREALLKLATDLTFFFLATQYLAASRGTWHKLGLTVTVFAFALALFATLQFFSSGDLIYWRVKPRWGGSVFGPYVNHNHFAGLMEMLIPVGVAAVLSLPRERPVRALLGFAVLVPIASVLLSGSRGGTISLIAEVLIMGVVLGRCAPQSGGRSFALLGTLGMTAALSLFLWTDPGQVSERLAGIFRITHSPTRDLSFLERKTVALDTLRILRDHPWSGAGLGSFEVAYAPYQSLPGDLVWVHAHNDYAEALAETGVAGGSLILTALAMFFSLGFRNLSERLQTQAGWIQLGAAVGCCGLLVHSFTDFNLHIPANAAWFAACLGITQGDCGKLHARSGSFGRR